VTNPGGEVIVTTSGGYSSFAILQAVTVTAAPGVYASITGSIGISPGANDRVVIKGMHVILPALSGVGISAIGYGSLFVEDCQITGGQKGVSITGSNAQSVFKNVVVRSFTETGFLISGHATLIGCRAERGQFSTGLHAIPSNAETVVSATDFVATGTEIGVAAISTSENHSVEVNLDHAVLSDNTQDGVEAVALGGGIVTVRVTHSTITNNGAYGLNQAGTAMLASLNNNLVAGNRAGDTVGTITVIPAH